ncbi:MAG: transcription repressor NadR [Clostridiales bacterium]|nr:transcription repressor NadR [Clostridiales bacterium]
MTASQRRAAILDVLSTSPLSVSASSLAQRFAVSRQVIVSDIALLRAAGNNISATPRGYLITPERTGILHQIACSHSAAGTRDELNAMVDCGCTVLDVIVEHPVYGQLTASLQIASRYDVEQFLSRMKDAEALPLSMLTEGIHLHTVLCPSEAVYAHLKESLRSLGVLLSESV